MKGTHCLFDIGAATGFMSAVYAAGNPEAEKIASIEPDPYVFPILQRAVSLNSRDGLDWAALRIAVGDRNGDAELPVEPRVRDLQPSTHMGSTNVDMVTLSGLAERVGFLPDIIKLDIESYEYEVLTSSFDFIAVHKPAFQLEIHWEMLDARGKDPSVFLDWMAKAGYRTIDGDATWTVRKRNASVSRVAIRV
jgi:FkbM family methyltransferase